MKKICLYDRRDILNITRWLNEYADYGWALQSWGRFFVKFEESKGDRFRYQLDMDNWEDGANAERRAELEALGWNYVETIPYTRIHIYRSLNRKASIPPNEEFIRYNRKKLRFFPFWNLAGALLALTALLLIPLSNQQFFLLELTQMDKGTRLLYAACILLITIQFFDNILHDYRLDQYLGSLQKDIDLEEAQISACSFALPYIRLICRLLSTGFMIGVICLTFVPEKGYIEGAFVQRYYPEVGGVSEELWNTYGAHGNYWMNVSENVDEKLFSQIVERYSAYSNYYGHGFFRKSKYDTRDWWTVEERTDERFDRLVVAQGIGGHKGEWLIFAQQGNDIIYLKCRRTDDISGILDHLNKTM